jgi:hypothetical protein
MILIVFPESVIMALAAGRNVIEGLNVLETGATNPL